MNLPKSLQFSTFKKYSTRKVVFFWYRNYKLIFFLGFLITLGIGGYVWYHSVHTYVWSDEQKKAYVTEYFKETEFKETKFQNLVERLRAREESHIAKFFLTKNLFTGDTITQGQ